MKQAALLCGLLFGETGVCNYVIGFCILFGI